MSKPHIILVHGAYHQAWHMHLLKEELEKAGYKVSSIDLPSCGDNAPESGALEADIHAMHALFDHAASESDSILPVFHSYAGIPGGEAVAELSDPFKKKVQRLVYLASFALQPGTPLRRVGAPFAPWSAPAEKGKFMVVPDPIPSFYHDVEPELAKEAAARVVKSSQVSFTTEIKHAGWRFFPRTYIVCKEDRARPRVAGEAMFGKMSDEEREGWDHLEIEGSHSPFLSRPAEFARVLRKIAGEDVEV